MKGAYYSENDPFCVEWLKRLILADLIAPGDVDDRSILDVKPDDLRGYGQHHFFAGIGVWSHALRLAGWPDDRPVWTGSCPCPPFSHAGKRKSCLSCGSQSLIPCPSRVGFFVCCLCGFAWSADQRHLWPKLWSLARDFRPDVILGEQVASSDGRTWVDLVRASLEILDYSVGVSDLCAAGVGAPHIRQRLWWVAHNNKDGRRLERCEGLSGIGYAPQRYDADGCSEDDFLADPDGRDAGAERQQRGREHGQQQEDSRARLLVDAAGEQARLPRRTRQSGSALAHDDDERLEVERQQPARPERQTPERGGEAVELGVTDYKREAQTRGLSGRSSAERGRSIWSEADWIACRDGKWRPVEAGTSPLVDGAPGRVGQLRAYGNAIVAPLAQAFIESVIDILDEHRLTP